MVGFGVVFVCVRCSGTRGLMDGLNTPMTHKSKERHKGLPRRGMYDAAIIIRSEIKIKPKPCERMLRED